MYYYYACIGGHSVLLVTRDGKIMSEVIAQTAVRIDISIADTISDI